MQLVLAVACVATQVASEIAECNLHRNLVTQDFVSDVLLFATIAATLQHTFKPLHSVTSLLKLVPQYFCRAANRNSLIQNISPPLLRWRDKLQETVNKIKSLRGKLQA